MRRKIMRKRKIDKKIDGEDDDDFRVRKEEDKKTGEKKCKKKK